jgi:hypothetical protein
VAAVYDRRNILQRRSQRAATAVLQNLPGELAFLTQIVSSHFDYAARRPSNSIVFKSNWRISRAHMAPTARTAIIATIVGRMNPRFLDCARNDNSEKVKQPSPCELGCLLIVVSISA